MDGCLPCRTTEVLSVQQDSGAPVGFARLGGHNVHVGHLQGLALGGEAELLNPMGVVKAFKTFAERWLFGARNCERLSKEGKAGEDSKETGHGILLKRLFEGLTSHPARKTRIIARKVQQQREILPPLTP